LFCRVFLEDNFTMQRFGLFRRPLMATFLALCAVGISVVPFGSRQLLAQDKTQPAPAPADAAVASTDPILVLTVASLNKLMQDVNYISGVMGQPQAGGMFTMMAGSFTQGLDTSRPIGILVPMVDGSPEPIGVLPTDDVESMLKARQGLPTSWMTVPSLWPLALRWSTSVRLAHGPSSLAIVN